MVTTWTQGRLDKSTSLLLDREYLSALRELLVILDVYPDQPEGLRLTASASRG
ncbi:hypothetical protein [Actinomadura decatromicini]|uniref:hypothetical protein n=1 Tax=Actinomadura decatromicini TaxID=2604572 RepID=UPI0016530FBC|nr:hypothetical protein [Actinomadura decatromicini]